MSLKISNKDMSTSDLYYALQYVESIAQGAKNKVGETNHMIQAQKLERKLFEEPLKKMYDIFMEFDQLSFKIESELDKRFKPRLGSKYTSKTLLDTADAIDKIFMDNAPKEEKKEDTTRRKTD